MEKKICKRCFVEKDLSEFYKHSRMKDGFLNFCILCKNNEQKDRYKNNILNKEYVDKQRKRGRDKYDRLYKGKKNKKNIVNRKIIIERYKYNYPEKYKARYLSQYLPCNKGNELHHWSYKDEHFKDVIELSKDNHYTIHNHIYYDKENKQYRRIDNDELLDTKEKHLDFIKEIG